jgi:hypothetical protein
MYPEEGEYYALALPGFWLRVAWLWRQPTPKVPDVLRSLKVIA